MKTNTTNVLSQILNILAHAQKNWFTRGLCVRWPKHRLLVKTLFLREFCSWISLHQLYELSLKAFFDFYNVQICGLRNLSKILRCQQNFVCKFVKNYKKPLLSYVYRKHKRMHCTRYSKKTKDWLLIMFVVADI